MSLWDKITSLFKTAEEPAEETATAVEIFKDICTAAGLGDRVLNSVQALEKFEAWYDGPCDEESIRASLADFKKQHPGVNAKLTTIGSL
tara:strand:- start:102 stop:368 length:267 start_codon:yes stop_codon:yes gene_type:complete